VQAKAISSGNSESVAMATATAFGGGSNANIPLLPALMRMHHPSARVLSSMDVDSINRRFPK
jgi:hypothetical protein